MKYAITTLGCKVNQFETETMEGLFKQKGYEIVPFTEKADVYVVNTCAVTGEAERQCRQAIRKLRKENPTAKIIVTGCAAQVSSSKFADMPEVDLVLGNKEKTESSVSSSRFHKILLV